MAMVHGQNKKDAGIGGHISTYSSLATLLEVGFNHFFHAHLRRDSPATSSTSRAMPRPACTRAPYLEGRFDERGSRTSATSCAASPACPAIRTPG